TARTHETRGPLRMNRAARVVSSRRRSGRMPRRSGSSELHRVQLVEQGLGVELVTGLARVVGAKGETAHAGKLLSRNLGILLAVHLLPEVLVETAAVHLGLRRRGSGHQAERNKADDRRPNHEFLR